MFPAAGAPKGPYDDRDSVVEWYSTLFSLYGIKRDDRGAGETITTEQQYSPMKILGNDIIITPPGTETYNAIRIFDFNTYMENKAKPFMYVKCTGTGTIIEPEGEPGEEEEEVPVPEPEPEVEGEGGGGEPEGGEGEPEEPSLTVDIVIDLSNARQMRYGDNFRYQLTASTINMYTKATHSVTKHQYEQTGSYTFDKCDIAFIINSKTGVITPLYFNLVFSSKWGEYSAKITASSDDMSSPRNTYRFLKNTFLRMNESPTITKIIALSGFQIPYETHPIPIATLKGSRDTFTLQLLDFNGNVLNPITDVYNTLFAIQFFIADKDAY